jgi:amino acid adenylation domain-containing protein
MRLEYATDLFTAESAEQMAIHFEELLRSITANPDLAVGQLNLLPADERHRLLVEWNRTEREYPRDQCVHQLFEAQVERTPEAVAVEFEGRSLTYRELNCRANQLAHHLRGLGVGPDTPVALCVERSLEMVVGPLGILKAGGAYVPLDPSYPSKRLAYLIGNMATPVLVTQAALVSRFPGSRIKTIYLENLPPDTTEDNPNLPISTKNLAYILYTSGSTGQPKGVAMEHGPLVNLMHWQVSQTQVPLRTLQFASLSFDVSFQEIFSTWLSGGTLVVVDSQTRLNPAALWEFVTERKLERLFLPVVMLQHLADAAAGSSRTAPELREVITAGEQLRITPAIRSFFAARPGCTLHNHYGPTESHVVTAWTLPSCPANWPELPPIGRPIANATIYLLDAQMNLVPVGRPGELYIGGAALARGYWRQSGITAERFVPDPFAPNTNARLYRTGDLAYYRPDGNIEYLGRIDFQVKIRGFRIELGEIETVLHVQPEVREAAAIVREDTPDDKRLIAYLVAKNGEKPDVLTLRKRLAEKLPDYMIPNHFVWLDRLPLTPNGKLDRKALRAPETSDGSKPDLKSRPINMLELELIRIWRRLFQREGISRRDNFFALGGHSLLAARLAAEIDKLLKCKLPIATLFQSPTIESLARRLADDNWAPPWSSLVPLQPQGSKPPLFLVHGWGGDVYGHLKLAKLLPPDQPSYGIQAVGLDGKSARHITVEEMAAHYVTEIVSFQPDGPIYLAGYSMGGLIAFEVAQQLHRLGRRVAMLALLDSAPISEIPWVFYGLSMATYIPDRCLFHFRRWLTLSRHEKSSYLRGRWTALRFWINNNFSKPPPVTIPPQPASQPPQVPGFGDYYHAVASAYRVRPYSGSADIFVSDQANPEWKWWYWKYYVRGGVSCHRIPGRHLQILSPDYLPALAKSLTTVIHRTQEKERNTPHSHSGHNISTTEPITTLEKLQDD